MPANVTRRVPCSGSITRGSWTASTVARYNDAPFQVITLPFTFYFYGTPYQVRSSFLNVVANAHYTRIFIRHSLAFPVAQQVRISPNGALHLDAKIPCCTSKDPSACVFTIPTTCTLDSSYSNVIMGYLADMNPLTKPTSKIEVTPRVGRDG